MLPGAGRDFPSGGSHLTPFALPFAGSMITRGRHARPWFAAMSGGILLVAVAAGAAGAVEGPTKLSNPQVSPRSGTTTTTISFAIDYRNREGSSPDSVRVLIDGRAHAMAQVGTGPDYKSGVRFAYTTKLAAGSHAVSFQASDRQRFSATAPGGTVRISRAAGATSGGTTGGTTTPGGSTTTGGTGSGGPAGTGGTSADGTGTNSSAGAVPAATESPGGSSTSAVEGPSGAARSLAPGSFAGRLVDEAIGLGLRSSTSPAGVEEGSSPDSVSRPQAGDRTAEGPAVAIAVPAQLLAWPGGVSPEMRALAVAMGTTGAATAAMAFLIFGKRRRDEEQPAPDDVLEAAAANAGPSPATALLVPVSAAVQAGANAAELAMPRWRRPSLLQARKTDPLRSASTTFSLSFATGSVGPVAGLERRRIRYRVVRLLDAPDELRGTEIGVLDRDDEVQLLESSGAFWRVLCPDGNEGWLHRMTLGEAIKEDEAVAPARPSSGGEGDVPTPDNDVLSSFLRAEKAG